MEAPQALEEVIERISERIWSQVGKNQPIPFIVGGSYGAAVEAFRRTNGAKCLAYNDIDVWYKSLDDEDDGKDEILQVHYERDVFPDHPDMEVNVIRLGKLQLRALIEDFDTNNVQVGYKVVPRIEDGRLVAEVADTYVSAAFEDFLQTWTIRIVNPMSGKTRATTLIRLLYKAQQLDLPYDLPPEKDLLHIFHGRWFAPKNHDKLQRLQGPYRNEIFSRFEVVKGAWHRRNKDHCPYEGTIEKTRKTMYRLLRKESDDGSRILRSRDLHDAALDRYFDVEAFVTRYDLQSPRSQATTAVDDEWDEWEVISDCDDLAWYSCC